MKPSISFTVTITADEFKRLRNSDVSLDKLVADKLLSVRRAATPERVKRMFYQDDHQDTWGVK